MGPLVFLTLVTLFSGVGSLSLSPRELLEEHVVVASENPFPELEEVITNRGYAYVMALLVMTLFVAVVYCHVASIRKERLLQQYTQRGTLPEWSPLLIDGKNIRPPPPYEQVI